MKKGLKVFLILIFVALLGAAGYLYFNQKEALKIIFPEVDEIEKIHVKFLKDTAKIEVDFKLRNGGLFKLNIDSLIYNVKLDTSTFLVKEQNLSIELEPGETDTIRLPIALPFKRLIKKIRSLQGSDSADINFDIRVVYATVFGRAELPYASTIKIAVPIPPKIEVEKLEYLKKEKKAFYFNAHVRIINKGKLALNVSDINYKIAVKNEFTATGRDPRQISLKPNSELLLVLPIKVEFEHLLKTLLKVATNNDVVSYKLRIDAQVQSDKVGDDKSRLEIEKDGTIELKK